MWILQKVQAGAQNLQEQINHLISKTKEETKISNKPHSNVLTPDKIPDFFLPPKLTKHCLMLDTEKICLSEETKVPSFGKTVLSRPGTAQPLRKNINKSAMALSKLKPLPYSLKCFESGLVESPNTHRKESLFHSTLTRYTLERISVKTLKRSCNAALLVASIVSDTPSAESTSYSTPPSIRVEDFTCKHSFSEDILQKDITDSRAERKKVHSTLEKKPILKVSHHAKQIKMSSYSKLAPPIQLPLDMLHCQERFNQEHVLPLLQRGRVRISAFRSCAVGCSTTICIRVISVEGLRDPGDLRPLTCSLTLSIIPGKLQRQHSTIIRNCRNPVFNEDFFFQEPEEQHSSLVDLALRLKVLEKSSGLGRGVVLGVVIKPLCQLLPLLKTEI